MEAWIGLVSKEGRRGGGVVGSEGVGEEGEVEGEGEGGAARRGGRRRRESHVEGESEGFSFL